MALYPLKFEPILKQTIWGGERLARMGKKSQNLTHIGESWELSGYDEKVSVVSNGPLKGNELNELIEVYMSDLVGDSVYELFGNQFPLLFKFIDANDDLSIQVHPDDQTAFDKHGCMGKMEMWYILDAEPQSSIIVGFKEDCNKQNLIDALKSNRVEDLLQKISVKEGDTMFIAPGTIHGIGKGVLLAEIQQSSDITYRLYDFNRTDSKGNQRELHIEQALDVIKFDLCENPQIKYQTTVNGATNLVSCPYFTTNIIEFNQTIERDYGTLDSFVVYMCVKGKMKVCMDEFVVEVAAGETVLIPACASEIILVPTTPDVRLLEVYMDKLDEIE